MGYRLPYIISSKDFEKPVIVKPSGSTASKTGMILSWKLLYGLRNTSTNPCAVHKRRIKIHHAQKKHYVNMIT